MYMNVIVVCDQKPSECEKCMFWHEYFKASDKENCFELTNKCFLGSESIDECHLTEVKTVFSDTPEILGDVYDKT